MKNIFYITVFLSFASVSNLWAETDINARCKPFVESPDVTIESTFEPLKYDHTKVARTLERMHREEYGGSAHEGYQINGLATYKLGAELEFVVAKKTFNDGATCFYPQNIKLSIVFKEPTIYIARSLKKGTCKYNIALRHEQTHHQINLEVVEHFLPIIQNRFIETVKKYSFAGRNKDDISIEQAQKSLQKRYMQAIDPILDQIKNEIKQEQAKLDNITHYDYEQSLCQ